jgi:hypothetical protein
VGDRYNSSDTDRIKELLSFSSCRSCFNFGRLSGCPLELFDGLVEAGWFLLVRRPADGQCSSGWSGGMSKNNNNNIKYRDYFYCYYRRCSAESCSVLGWSDVVMVRALLVLWRMVSCISGWPAVINNNNK